MPGQPSQQELTPLVSVCMITYQQEAYIQQAIEGVLAQQTDFSFELVIGEDAGSDKTRQICEEYASRFPSIVRLLPLQGNLGIMPNFTRTLKACSGKYIALCEGDDYWTEPRKLQQQVDWLEANPDFAVCFHNAMLLEQATGDQKLFKTLDKQVFDTADIISRDWFIATHSIVFRKAAMRFPAWFEQVKSGDLSLLLICSLAGKLYGFPETWGVYRLHDQGANTHFNDQRHVVGQMIRILTLFDQESRFQYKDLVEKRVMYWLNYLGPHEVIHYIKEDRPRWVQLFCLDVWLRKGKSLLGNLKQPA